MSIIKDREALLKFQDEARDKINAETCRILICAGTGCLAGGSDEIYKKMCQLTSGNEDVEVEFGPEIAHLDGT